MECGCCSRGPDRDRPFYCSSCLSARLSDHRKNRYKALNLLEAQKRKNELLLRPPASSHAEPSPARAQPTAQHSQAQGGFGVEQERLLKAAKRTLAARVRDLREAVEVKKAEQGSARSTIEERKAALATRRSNLTEARSRLERLSTRDSGPSHATVDSTSLTALSAQLTQLSARHDHLRLQIAQVRAILTKELLAVYGFGAVAPSPSSSAHAAANNNTSPFIEASSPPKTPSSSVSTVSSSRASTRPTLPTYSIAGLPLPPMSQLLSLPPAVLSASLSHLLHLTRLLALYTTTNPLPFTPFPSLYGPGQPGIRSSPGWSSSTSSSGTSKPLAFPLFLAGGSSTRKKKTSSEPDSLLPSPGRSAFINEEQYAQQTGGLVALAGLGTRSEVRENREEERREAERSVRKGAIALGFDLAWLAWITGSIELSNDGPELEDLGGLVLKAAASTVVKSSGASAGASPTTAPGGAPRTMPDASPQTTQQQQQAKVKEERAPSERFPWEWDKLVAAYVVERDVESVVLVPRNGEEGGGEEERVEQSDEDEWDVV